MNDQQDPPDPSFIKPRVNRDAAEKMLKYLRWHMAMSQLTNEQLARKLIEVAPVTGALGELIDIAVERLSPGILQKITDDEIKQANATITAPEIKS